jgi:hypothetical protein
MTVNSPVSRSGAELANADTAGRVARVRSVMPGGGTSPERALSSGLAAGGAPPERRLRVNDRRWCEKGGRRGQEPAHERGPEHDGIGYGETTLAVTPTSGARAASHTSGKAWKVRDVAEFLQASESWVRHAAASGRLPCTKIGGLLRFDPNDIRSLARAEAPARVLPRR